ncbi:MAG: glycoside hydrolase [Actinomycetota bacterium]|nr:glycoside hydrolase [Actinomycetota bacterium]
MIYAATAEGLIGLEGDGSTDFKGKTVNALWGNPPLLAVVDGHEVWTRPKGGDWEQSVRVTDHRVNCALPVNGLVYLGTSDAHLLRVEGGNAIVVDEFETMAGRDDWFTPWGGPPDVRSLASDSVGVVYANVHVGGIARSKDGGRTWAPTIDIYSDVHEVTAADGAVLAACARGLAVSRDEGETWKFHAENLHATYARAVGRAGNSILMTACVGPHGGRAAVYRRDLDGHGAFEKCEQGLPEWFGDNIDTGCLATLGRKTAFGTSDGEVYVSVDAGGSWRRAASGLPPIRWLALDD